MKSRCPNDGTILNRMRPICDECGYRLPRRQVMIDRSERHRAQDVQFRMVSTHAAQLLLPAPRG